MIVWDREDHTAEASKLFNDESGYRSVRFKDKILQDHAEKSNVVFEGLKQKGKIIVFLK